MISRRLIAVALAVFVCPQIASADWYVPGGWDAGSGYNTWDINDVSTEMTDNLDGTYSITIINQTPDTRYEFKMVDTLGDWASHANDPDGSNMWAYSNSSGEVILTMDTNSVGNGFFRDSNRLLAENDPTNGWNAVGNFMDEVGGAGDWNNGDAAFTMADIGGGIFEFTTAAIGTVGTYNGRIVNTGTWDGFGTQGRSVDSWNYEFVINNPGDSITFTLDTTTGTSFASVNAVPEPASIAVLGLLGLAVAGRRRKN